MFLDSAYAKGKESDELSLDAAAYLDVSLVPIGPKRRRAYMDQDWQRGRYFWARVGYAASSRSRMRRAGPWRRTGASSRSR